jgi:isoquinoline 1-oxidoreductase beta subunit
METLIDELAMHAETDPIAYRLKLLNPDAKRMRVALSLLREKSAGWRRALSHNHAVGIACNEYHGTAVACAVDVSIEGKRLKIHRATVALDCGLAVNPLSVESQIQGELSLALRSWWQGEPSP